MILTITVSFMNIKRARWLSSYIFLCRTNSSKCITTKYTIFIKWDLRVWHADTVVVQLVSQGVRLVKHDIWRLTRGERNPSEKSDMMSCGFAWRYHHNDSSNYCDCTLYGDQQGHMVQDLRLVNCPKWKGTWKNKIKTKIKLTMSRISKKVPF